MNAKSVQMSVKEADVSTRMVLSDVNVHQDMFWMLLVSHVWMLMNVPQIRGYVAMELAQTHQEDMNVDVTLDLRKDLNRHVSI